MAAEQIAHIQERILRVRQNPAELYNEIEAIELDPWILIFPEELRFLQMLAKWAEGDYFALRMLIKRVKTPAKESEPLLKFYQNIEMYQRDLNFAELTKTVAAGKELFLADISLYVQARAKTEQHIIRTIAQYFTCYELAKLAGFFNKSSEEIRELAMLCGYTEEGGWVSFPPQKTSNSVRVDKQLLKDKQIELTQLSTLLSLAK